MAVVVGSKHVITLNDEGYCYTYGSNEKLQLGREGDNSLIPKKVNFSLRIIAIACGDNFSAFVCEEGNVWSFGLNEGQFSSEINRLSTPTKLEGLQNIRSIDAGKRYAICIDHSDELYGFGYNRSGELGFGKRSTKNLPSKIEGAKDIKQVSCGNFHTIFLNFSGKVFGCGSNTFKQLGAKIPHAYEGIFPLGFPDNIDKIACGSFHTVLLTDDNKIICYGSNTDGKSGVPKNKEKIGMNPIFPEDIIISQISAGLNHTAIVDNCGYLWLFGRCLDNNLHTSSKHVFTNFYEPTKSSYEFDSEILTLSSHGDAIIVKTSCGTVYQFSNSLKTGSSVISEFPDIVGYSLQTKSRQKSARK